MDATSIARTGIQASLARFDASAARVANVGATRANPVDEAIEQMVAKRSVEANVAVLRTAYDMQDYFFERFA